MANSNRIGQVYGYAVCLIAVITILISMNGLVKSLFDLSDPLRADGYGRGVSLTSYTAYKRDQQKQAGPIRARQAPLVSDSIAAPSETELRQMFEDERLDQIGAVRFRAMKTLVTSVLMTIVAIGLFLMHWRWLRREDLKV
jgi:hypothetical protein